MENVKRELDEFKVAIEHKFDKINEKIYSYSNSLSALEGAFETSESYIKNKFANNDKIFEYFSDQILEVRKEINQNENELIVLKKDFDTLKKSIYGRSQLGETKTVSEKIEDEKSTIQEISDRIIKMETNISYSLEKLSLLENEKELIKKIVNDLTGTTVYETAIFNFSRKVRFFVIKRLQLLKKAFMILLNRTMNSIFVKIILVLLAALLSAPIMQKITEIIQGIFN